METSVEVTSDNFAAEVVQRSYDKPVLVDFFAHWCGPCQMLKPMLEKLAQEYDFVLAKIDIDQNPELAKTYGVEGVPDVRIVVDGAIANGFVGMLPEPQVRELLTQLNLKSPLEEGLDAIRASRASGDLGQAKRLFGELIQTHPEDRRLILEAAHFLVSQNSLESAEKLLSVIQPGEKPYFQMAQAVRGLIQFTRELATLPEAEPGSLDQQYRQSVQAVLAEDYEAALQGFLAIVGRDRKYRQDGARKAMITVFDLLGDDDSLTKDYRKRLMQTMY